MTYKKVDHAEESREWVAAAERAGLSMEETSAFASIGQVHAMLALVEQQRIANLQREREVVGVRFDRSGNASGTVADEYMHIDGQIREALGLS